MAELLIVEPAGLAEAGARWLAAQAREALEDRGRFDVALAGGSTPRPVYEAFAAAPLPWPHVHVWLGDERCVPPDHPDSNWRMVRAALLDRVPAVGHRPEAERPDRAAAAAAYGAALPAALDAMVLGMGEDSHTASLFPGRAFDAPPGARVVAVAGAPKPPPERLTVTPAVIAAARALLVIVTGAGKAGPVARALEGPDRPDLYPVQLARRGTWLLDPAAASALSAPPKESPHG